MIEIKCAYDKLVKIEELKPHPKNPNRHSKEQIERLAKIVAYQGIRRPVRVSKSSGFITAGHGLVQALQSIQEKEVPVNYQDYKDEDQEYADIIADNSIASWAELDLASINLEVPSLGPDFDIDMLGIKDFEIEPADKYADKDADEVPQGRPTDIKRGDLFSLGNHRLLCGDATDKLSVERLMNGEDADMVFTDPPYNLNFDYNSYEDNLDSEKYMLFCSKWFCNLEEVSNKICITPGIQNLGMWCKILVPRAFGAWIKKNAMSGGRFSNLNLWEPILFYGDFKIERATDLFEFNVRQQSDTGNHTCPKVIELIVDIISSFSSPNQRVLDVFGGSGSTLIACEKTNRKCFMMEIDPQYCQVIIDRWEKFTGQKATKLP